MIPLSLYGEEEMTHKNEFSIDVTKIRVMTQQLKSSELLRLCLCILLVIGMPPG